MAGLEQLYRLRLSQTRRKDAARVEVFQKLMGPDVSPRRKFIQTHAKEVRNLDV